MKHWELEHAGELIRIEWNNAATFNLQTPVGGQWVDYHCFTCYGIDRPSNTPLKYWPNYSPRGATLTLYLLN